MSIAGKTVWDRAETYMRATMVNDDSHVLVGELLDKLKRLEVDRVAQDLAVRDAIRETAATADELAFWRYQAVFHRCLFLDPKAAHRIYLEDHPIWGEAERQLEAQRAAENRERIAHAEAPRDPGGT